MSDSELQCLDFQPHMLDEFKEDLIQSQSDHFSWDYHDISETLARGQAWVICDDNKPQAICGFQGSQNEWELLFCLTQQNARGQGLMKKLLLQVLEGPLANTKVFLEVHPANTAAIKLYEALGFSKISERNQYYRDGAPALIYRYDS